jgi:hypothetical protein
MTLEELLKLKIVWDKVTTSEGIKYISEINGIKGELRLNDFPEEALYTLFFEDIEWDFDDLPENWKIYRK